MVNVPEQPWIQAPEPPQKPTFSQSGSSITFTNIDKETRVIAIYANNYLIGKNNKAKFNTYSPQLAMLTFQKAGIYRRHINLPPSA